MADTIVKGISIKFAVDDVEFDKSIDSINKSLKTLKNQVKSYNKELKIDPSNTDVLKKKLENLSKQEELLKKQLKGYTDELKNLSDLDVETHSEKWMALRDNIEKTQKSLEYVTKEEEKIAKMNPMLLGVGKGFNDMSNSLKKAADSTAALSAAAAAASVGIVKLTNDAANNAGDMKKLANQYNLSLQEIQKFSILGDLVDTDLSTITKSFSKLTKNMTSTSKEVAGAFNTLGIEVKDTNGELRNSNSVFYETIEALSKIENETLQDNLAMQIFGKSAADLGPLINGEAEHLAELNKYLEENSLLLSDEEIETLDAYSDTIGILQATLQAFKNKVAKDLAPLFDRVLNKIQDALLKVKNAWDKLSPTVKQLIPIITGILAALAPVLLITSKISSAVGGLLTSLGGGAGMSGILSTLTGPIGIVTAALAVLFATSEEFRESMKDLAKQLMDDIQPVIESIKGLIDTLISKFNEVVLPILQTVGSFIAKYVVPIIKELANLVLPLVADAITTVSEVLGWLFDIIGSLWDYLEDVGVIEAFGKAFEGIKEFIVGFIEKIKEAVEWISNLISKFLEWLGIRSSDDDKEYSSYNSRNNGGSNSNSSRSNGAVNNITLNSSFTANGTLNESEALRYADLMSARINENLGKEM